MLAYGKHEDEHAGEQYYTENIRILSHNILTQQFDTVDELIWLTGKCKIEQQIKILKNQCFYNMNILEKLYYESSELEDIVFKNTLVLQLALHYLGRKGVILFANAFTFFREKDYERAFVEFGRSAECFLEAESKMRDAEYGNWKDFYKNDCFADYKHTAYLIQKVMGYIRELGDNVRHDEWYHKYCYSKVDQKVYLLLVTDNHLEDWELYQIMKNKSI